MSSTRLKIRHSTRYDFPGGLRSGLQQVRTTPKSGHGQTVLSWSTEVIGGHLQVGFDDHHRNRVELLSIDRDAPALTVISEGEVEIADTTGVVGRHLGPAPLWLYKHQTATTRPGPGVRALVRAVADDDPLPQLHDLSARIRDTVDYVIGSSAPDWSAEDAIAAAKGVCQDHTHIFVSAARELGFPARYVSGYLMLDDRIDQEAMHAWAEAHVDGLGWVGFDVSNGISPDTRYVRVATGLDYAEAAPVTGLRLGGEGETLAVEIEVAEQVQ